MRRRTFQETQAWMRSKIETDMNAKPYLDDLSARLQSVQDDILVWASDQLSIRRPSNASIDWGSNACFLFQDGPRICLDNLDMLEDVSHPRVQELLYNSGRMILAHETGHYVHTVVNPQMSKVRETCKGWVAWKYYGLSELCAEVLAQRYWSARNEIFDYKAHQMSGERVCKVRYRLAAKYITAMLQGEFPPMKDLLGMDLRGARALPEYYMMNIAKAGSSGRR